jgi:predicted transcriptional regulator
MGTNQKAATVMLVMLTVSICFAAVATASTSERPFFLCDFQNINNLHPQLTATVPLMVGASLHSNQTQPLDQPTRLEIYSFIQTHPGVHFRGICGSLGLSVGVVQYHLAVLEKAGYITVYGDGQNQRYFKKNAYTQSEMKLISLARHETAGKILTVLAQSGSALHKDIAHSLGISSQALSWQINQLEKAGLINAEKTGINVKYSLNNAAEIKCILNLTNNLEKI